MHTVGREGETSELSFSQFKNVTYHHIVLFSWQKKVQDLYQVYRQLYGVSIFSSTFLPDKVIETSNPVTREIKIDGSWWRCKPHREKSILNIYISQSKHFFTKFGDYKFNHGDSQTAIRRRSVYKQVSGKPLDTPETLPRKDIRKVSVTFDHKRSV